MKSANRLFLSLLAAALLVALPALAQQGSSAPAMDQNSQTIAASSAPASTGSMDQADAQFLKKAAEDDMAEIQLGQLAMQNSTNNDVKAFAKQLVEDHTKDLEKVKSIAEQKGVQLPTSLDPKDQKTLDELSKLHGQPFDTAFLRHEARDHSKDIAKFKDESKKAQDPAVKSYAENDVHTLQHHLQIARNLGPASDTAINSGGGALGSSTGARGDNGKQQQTPR